MQGQQQQAYDRGITIFSPDGRLYQVEYAREAVKRGSPSVGVRTAEGVVLAADKRRRSEMIEPDSVEKLHKADEHIGIASAGHVADARKLIDVARRESQVNRLRYGEPIAVETLTKTVTDFIQQYTQYGGARPFGVSLIVGGVTNGEPRLFECDPSGTPYEWRALSVGANRNDIREHLEAEYDDEMSLEDGVDLALSALTVADDEELTPEGVDLATIDAETAEYVQLPDDEIEEHLEKRDLLPSDDDEAGDDEAAGE
ncbi:archaeal proteasome endopeptidase complex subunit alpha [Halolamina litorea]|uniref:Proteasome subunit alpha n=1 Tax=Halolamina litorea TaxID=1515593 RepID=A0ABD6BR24_9EURY|nr:archaeal proteasome endopeptidase complex subunit alpha [Halolamina litorea]